MKKIRRVDWIVVLAAFIALTGCGGGCDGCGIEPIPGGFPAAKRTGEAVQVRITPTGLGKITADPAAVIGPLVGNAVNGKINFPVPASCGGDTEICCVNGVPAATCGPIEIDLNRVGNEAARLEIVPQAGASRMHLTIRARVRTLMNLPIKATVDIFGFPTTVNCQIGLNTMADNTPPDLKIDTDIIFSQDPVTGTTRIEAQNSALSQLDDGDISISGGGTCTLAGLGIGLVKDTLTDQISGVLTDTINEATCKSCEGTDVATCGSTFANTCEGGTCMINASGGSPKRCLQETGIVGRMRGSAVLGGFSPGTTGAIDLYEILGGYAKTDNNGISLGMLGGMQPGGTDKDRCGPRGTEPALVDISELALFQGNTRTDIAANTPFDVGIGLHKSQLEQFAFAGYDGGFLCLTIGNTTVTQLNTDTLSLLSRSLGNLVESSAPMAIGLRPQKQPTIVLGKNTFMDDGMGGSTLVEPLLDLTFEKMEIDFFASIDEQYVRVFTVVSDVHLPIGLQATGMGEIAPVIGAVENAFTNVSVKNSEAVKESPEELAELFPTLLNLVLPQLSGGLGGFELPAIGGLNLSVTAITSVDNNNFMAIFANLVTGTSARPVETRVTLAGVEEPAAAIARDPKKWRTAKAPSVHLDLGDAQNLEWSYRTDSGLWSTWSTNRRPVISPRSFWLPGQHKIEVRARERGKPETMDKTPEVLEVLLGTDVQLGTSAKPGAPFHGQASSSGCSCDSSGNRNGTALFALVILAVLLPLRRMAKRAARQIKRAGLVVWTAALAALPGCSCGDAPCGDADCLPGEVENGGIGRYTSIAGDDSRVLVATYDTGLGDLVVADVTDPAAVKLVAVDGVPDITPIYEPSTYRGGVSGDDPGPNVGTWTAIALQGGLGRVAYHDRDETSLKFAYETKKGGEWKNYTLDPSDGEEVGTHTSMVIDAAGHPVVAYIAQGNDDGAGHRTTELRLARSNVVAPEDANDWSISLIAQATGSCAGLCAASEACIAGGDGEPESCTATTNDCAASCDTGQACVGGSCVDELLAPTTSVLASGTGLYVSLVVLPDGRLAATYYNRNARSLMIAVEDAVNTGNFTETVLDAAATRDAGMWSSAIVDGGGVVHVAYQDAIGDQLMYTTWNGSPGTPEVVDDGQRTGDRPHSVGASAAIYLVNGTPSIAYHDAITSDVYVATKGGAWTNSGLATGLLLDGISIDVTSGAGATYFAWDSIDPNASPVHSLAVRKQ